MAPTLWRLSTALLFLFAALLTPGQLLSAQEKDKDKGTVFDDLLDILRKNNQITPEQAQELRERARREQQGQPLAGIDENLKPYLRSPDGNFRLELGGFVQFDYDGVESNARQLTGGGLNDTFLIRRARVSMAGQMFKWVGFKIEGDWSSQQSNNFELTDGYIDLNFMPQVGLRGGQFKEPFSPEEITSDLFIDTIERSMVNELAPSRDVGAMLQGQLFDRIFGYAIGVFNGSGQNTQDNDDEKDLAMRLTLSPFRNTDLFFFKGLNIGVDGTLGDEDQRTSARGRTTARTTNRFTFFAQQPTNGNRYRWGVDVAWLIGPGSLKFEYDQQRDQRKRLAVNGGDLDSVRANGFYVTGTYLLTGENSVLNGPVIPRRPFSPLTQQLGPGAWELVGRYQQLKFSSNDPVDFFDGNIRNGITGGGTTAENGAEAVTVGLNWYLNSRVRAMANWTRYWFDNDLGTPFSCKQGSCGASTLQSAGGSWEFLTRLQLWF